MKQQAGDKIAAIQLLRALAAFIVAAGHIAFAFADHIGPGLGLAPIWSSGLPGQLAVMLFFIVSGYVMVLASTGQFAAPGSRSLFWRRRFIRIMPPYWLATLLLALIFLTLFPTPIDAGKFARSLALIPYWPDTGHLRPMPFLWVGWTLLYEMMFYFIFGLFLAWPRQRALLGVAVVLSVLMIAGTWVPPVSAFLFAVTRPVSVMFAAGMAIALWRMGGGGAPAWLRWLALVGSALAAWLVLTPPLPSALGWDYLAWAGLPALLIAFAALAGALPMPGTRWINRAGDISYAVYLFHVPIAWFWLWAWPHVPGFDPGPWDYFVSALLATIAGGWLFHIAIERPMTLALNRRLAAPHIGKELHRKTT